MRFDPLVFFIFRRKYILVCYIFGRNYLHVDVAGDRDDPIRQVIDGQLAASALQPSRGEPAYNNGKNRIYRVSYYCTSVGSQLESS